MNRVIKFKIYYENKLVGFERLTNKGWEWNWLELNPNDFERWNKGVVNDSHIDALKRVQFTGLTDKNGKEIYEGDILQWISSNPFSLGELRTVKVDYIQAQYLCSGRVVGVYLAELLVNERCEVIGNVFENKQLLNQ